MAITRDIVYNYKKGVLLYMPETTKSEDCRITAPKALIVDKYEINGELFVTLALLSEQGRSAYEYKYDKKGRPVYEVRETVNAMEYGTIPATTGVNILLNTYTYEGLNPLLRYKTVKTGLMEHGWDMHLKCYLLDVEKTEDMLLNYRRINRADAKELINHCTARDEDSILVRVGKLPWYPEYLTTPIIYDTYREWANKLNSTVEAAYTPIITIKGDTYVYNVNGILGLCKPYVPIDGRWGR